MDSCTRQVISSFLSRAITQSADEIFDAKVCCCDNSNGPCNMLSSWRIQHEELHLPLNGTELIYVDTASTQRRHTIAILSPVLLALFLLC